MADIAKRTVIMWCNEDELAKWIYNIETNFPKLSQKHTKKSNIMVHVTIESPIDEKR
jgi:hypothetical protein